MNFLCITIPKLQIANTLKYTYVHDHYPSEQQLQKWQQQWQHIHRNDDHTTTNNNDAPLETQEITWLIEVFNTLFSWQNVQLIKGGIEPEYFPASTHIPAQIVFAHGYFSSALHEISHWCLAGSQRRDLADYGYWYAPDGRNAQQQQLFEQVEIKPQAIEYLLTCACNKLFHTSKDNLGATFDTSQSTFEQDVYQQAQNYLTRPHLLPKDALLLLNILKEICQ